MNSARRLVVRRLLAFTLDWLVVLLWGGVLFGVVAVATAGDLPQPAGAWQAQGMGFLVMTLPVTLYFAVSEASPARASLGKWAVGLVVLREAGGRVSFGTSLARNAIKFLPWELGHTVAHQAAFSGDRGLEAWVWGLLVLSCSVPCWWLIAMFVTGNAPYDHWTKVRVALATGPEESVTT